jgi:LytS/YehU family sensor histidine kinase
LAIHLGAIVVLTALHCIAIVAVEAPKDFAAARASWAACMTRGMLLLDAFLYLTVSLAGMAMRLRQKHRERERDVSRLEVQLAHARLRTLEAQLHPHFAFNALNAVAMLIRERRNDVALRTLVAFTDLLRQFLTRDTPMVTLGSELETVRRYLDIESMRFADRLQVVLEAEPDALHAEVPNLLLQPLVENSIRHGASVREGPFHLRVHARVERERLVMTVEDDGPGLPPGWSAEQSTGLGLRNTGERLRQAYGDAARFDLGCGEGKGLKVSIEVPVRAPVEVEP